MPFANKGFARDAQINSTPLTSEMSVWSGAGGNVVTLNRPEGLFVVDGGLAAHSGALFRQIYAGTRKRRVDTLFNTHWHWDHTGSNELLARQGTRIFAHEYTKQWLSVEIESTWEHRVYPQRPKTALPTETFVAPNSGGTLRLGGMDVAYGHTFQAHTDGDIYVHFPDANVLVVGDLLAVGRYPVLDYVTGGWIGGLLNANKRLLTLVNDATRIVPGTGPVQTRADLQAHHDMLAALREKLAGLIKKGMNSSDMIAAQPTKEFDAKWGNPEGFLFNAYRGLWGHARELGGIV